MVERPTVECSHVHPTLFVSDVPAAVDFYTAKLGFFTGFTWGEPPTLAGVNLGNVQLFLEQGTPNPTSGPVYFKVGDADELYEFQKAQGVEIVLPPTDQSYGLRDYAVRDLHGHYLAFGHNIVSGGPPLKIERVDVPVRLEKRLAALLKDLAEHKHMSVDSCLEEMLLHTNDGVGPHLDSTVRYIQKLKEKHGIDYDSHASYRFVEGA